MNFLFGKNQNNKSTTKITSSLYSVEGKDCIRCGAFWGPRNQDYLCSFCFEGHIPLTKQEKYLFQKNFKKNMKFELRTFQTFTDEEFKVFSKNCNIKTAEELFQLLIGLREYPRIMLNSSQSTELFNQLSNKFQDTTDDKTFCDVITLMFCFEPYEVSKERKAAKSFSEGQEVFQSEGHIFELLKSWKYKHGKLSYYQSRDFEIRQKNNSRFITNCSKCNEDICLMDDFDECYNCRRLFCQYCFELINDKKIIFGKKRNVLKKCEFCGSQMLKMKKKLNDLNFIFK